LEIYALVGPSGSGKSHRALIVAHKYQIETIIDDGLLIEKNKILAGRSAKRASTKIGAIRRAIFMNPVHAREIKEVLEQKKPQKVLILGTSEDMVESIKEALDFPEIKKKIMINEVASEEDIEMAKKIRSKEGKHVIPVPTIEVKREFPGSLVDSIEVFFMRRIGKSKQYHQKLGEKSVVRPSFSLLGKLVISDDTIYQIVEYKLKNHEAVNEINNIDIQVDGDEIVIDLSLTLFYGYPIPVIIKRMQDDLVKKLEYMTGLDVSKIDVIVKNIILEENDRNRFRIIQNDKKD